MDGTVAMLLGAVDADGTVDLTMEAGHHVADDLGDGGRDLAFGFGIGAAEGHESMPTFELFGFGEADAELLGDLLGDRVAGDGDSPGEEAAAVDEQQVGAAPADVEHHGALIIANVVGTSRVVAGRRGDVDQERFQTDRLDRTGHLLHNLVLDDDEHHVHLFVVRIGNELIVPDHFVHVEGDVLLGLELDDLADAFLVFGERREFDEAGEGGLSRHADEGTAGLEAVLDQHLAQEAGNDDRASAFGQLLLVLTVCKVRQGAGTVGGVFELTHLDAGGTDVDGQDAV